MKLLPSVTHRPRSASPSGDAGDPRRADRGARRRIAALATLAMLWGAAAAAQHDRERPVPQLNLGREQIADPFFPQRRSMVDDQIRQRGIEQRGLLRAMEAVPRHLFVPEIHQPQAYDDAPVEIAPGKTISQAYLSALMISLLELDGDEKVLEIGTGSGYDAALLSRIVRQVYTIEIDRQLGRRAETTLRDLGYRNVEVLIGDGYRGWPAKAPFDAILVTTAPPRPPQPLIAQLKVGGRMVVPVGDLVQDLQVITKTRDGIETRKVSLVNLVPMEGEVERQPGSP